MRRRTRHHPSKLPSDLPNVKNTHISDNNRQKLCCSSAHLIVFPPRYTIASRLLGSSLRHHTTPFPLVPPPARYHIVMGRLLTVFTSTSSLTHLCFAARPGSPLLTSLFFSLTIIVHSSSMNSFAIRGCYSSMDSLVITLSSLPVSHLPASSSSSERATSAATEANLNLRTLTEPVVSSRDQSPRPSRLLTPSRRCQTR